MPTTRKVVLKEGEVYHVFNRSVASQEIFTKQNELYRTLDLIDFYRLPQILKFSEYKNLSVKAKQEYITSVSKLLPLIELYAFAIMPDHYHLLLKQCAPNGIRVFVSNLQNSYAKYFNKKHNRHGSLFQNPFKAKWIGKEKLFTHVSRYIHLNPVTSFMIDINDLKNYPYTSYPQYISNIPNSSINTAFLTKLVGSVKRYKYFVENQSDYQRKLHLIKKTLMD